MVDILEKTLRLAHPIMPFITEEIWNQFKQHHGSDKSSLMISDYPVQIENVSESDFLTIEWLKEAVTGIRNIRGELSIKPSTKISAIFKGGASKDKESLEKVSNYMMELSGFKNILWADEDEADPPSSILAIKKLRILIPLEGLIDADEEEQRLNKKISKLEQEKDMLGKKLNNKKFVDNAPKDLVLNQKDRFSILETELNNLKNQLIEIKKLI
jgi:valyl-tRNA synthetase